MLPLKGEADDPPRGRILVAWSDAEAAIRLQCLLRELGYAVVGPAGSREEVEALVARPAAARRPLDCALVHLGLPGASEIADRLAGQLIPLVWLAPGAETVLPLGHAHAPVVDRPFDRSALLAAIDEATKRGVVQRLYPVPPPQAAWPRIFPQL
jgi:hypothetical protein